jgi:hypothetical protein
MSDGPNGKSLPAVQFGHGPLEPHQRNTIAMMTVAGLPASTIASAVGRPPSRIKKLIEEDREVGVLIEEYRGRVVNAMAFHQFDMMGMLKRCREVVREGLEAPDIKVRLDTAKWTINEVIPKPTERVDMDLNIHGNIEVSQAVPLLVEAVSDLRRATKGTNFMHHVRSELPGAKLDDVSSHDSVDNPDESNESDELGEDELEIPVEEK